MPVLPSRTSAYLAALLSSVALLTSSGAGAAGQPMSVTPLAADPWQATVRQATERAEAMRRQRDPAALAEALARRAEALQTIGDRTQALADAQEARQLLPIDAAPARRAAVAGVVGQALLLAARGAEAEPLLLESIRIAREARLPRIEAAASNDLGLRHAAMGRGEAAQQAFDAATDAAARAGAPLLATRALMNSARAFERAGQGGLAADRLARAAQRIGALPAQREKALELAAAGELARRLAIAGRPALRVEAERWLNEAAALAGSLGDAYASAYSLSYLAELRLDQGRGDDALALARRAQFAAQSSGQTSVMFITQWQSARLLDRAGESAAALAAWRLALESLAAIKPDLTAEVWAAGDSWRDRLGPAFLGFVDLLLRESARDPDAARVDERLREARAVLERFKTFELEDYFRDDCVARYLAQARTLEQAAPRTAVIYPIVFPDRTELLVSIGTRMHRITVPASESQLREQTLALRMALERRTTFQYLAPARQLYSWLVRPLEPVLAGASVDTLVWVPDGPLRGLPLAALHDGNDFLIARYALAIAPSLTLVETSPLGGRNPSILAVGLSESVQGFPALPAVRGELDELSGYGARPVLLDRAFSADAFEGSLRAAPFSVVHVASHGEFRADSRESFLLTWEGRVSIDDLERQMRATRLREQPVELLFLSACQTAAGDERAALGLAGVAVKAGARSAVATLWQVSDQATSVLVSEFYRRLAQPGTSKAEAMRQAQLALAGDIRLRHPGLWAQFMLIGNWL